jgi:hypothetical protein
MTTQGSQIGFYFVLGLLLISTGCATKPHPLTANDQAAIQSQENMKAYHYGPASLSVMSGGARSAMVVGVLFGAVGGAIGGGLSAYLASSAGKEMMTTYQLEDPIVDVKAQFLSAFSETFGFSPIESILEPIGKKELSAQSQEITGVILDFKTIQWGLSDKTVEATISYQAHARVFQATGGKVLWEEKCNIQDNHETATPKLKEIQTMPIGALWKERFATVGRKCADEILAKAKGAPSA